MTEGPASAARAVVDHDLCSGVAQCVYSAPGAFELDGDGLSVFNPTGFWTRNELNTAADMCPMSAITILDGTSQT